MWLAKISSTLFFVVLLYCARQNNILVCMGIPNGSKKPYILGMKYCVRQKTTRTLCHDNWPVAEG